MPNAKKIIICRLIARIDHFKKLSIVYFSTEVVQDSRFHKNSATIIESIPWTITETLWEIYLTCYILW